MTDKSAAAARELVERWMGKKHPITMQSYVSDLTALISEHYYPNEFLLWTGENCQYYPDTNEWMYFESPMTQQYFKGTDELFNYWKENEQ